MTLGVLRCIIPVLPTFSGQNTRNLQNFSSRMFPNIALKTSVQCFELNRALLQVLCDQLVQVEHIISSPTREHRRQILNQVSVFKILNRKQLIEMCVLQKVMKTMDKNM